jgi:hypothetical protein
VAAPWRKIMFLSCWSGSFWVLNLNTREPSA